MKRVQDGCEFNDTCATCVVRNPERKDCPNEAVKPNRLPVGERKDAPAEPEVTTPEEEQVQEGTEEGTESPSEATEHEDGAEGPTDAPEGEEEDGTASENEAADEEEEDEDDEVSPTTEPKQCKATTSRGAQCKNEALPGSEFCAVHS